MPIWNVCNTEKIIDEYGRVHLPRKFLDHLNIGVRNVVQIYADWEEDVRIRKKTTQNHRQHVYEQSVDPVGKLLLPKALRDKFSLGAGNLVLVSLYEGYDEIRIKKIRRKRPPKKLSLI